MRSNLAPAPSVVVGIDGSRSALDAALWAVDEAASRDVPLRLIYAIDPLNTASTDVEGTARDLAAAETAVRYAFTAVESTDKPVKIEVEILQTPAKRALLEASRWSAMVCVGSKGLTHHDRIGATAAAVATAAHCPVAIVREHDPGAWGCKWVVAEVDESPSSNGVLQCAIGEARLRGAPLRVLTTWQLRYSDIHDSRAVADGNRMAKAQLDRNLAHWKKRFPDLEIEAVAAHGTTLNYLTEHTNSIQLLVVGHERARGISDLVGPPGYASLHDANCSVLICGPQNVL